MGLLSYLREFNFISVVFRLLLASAVGGVLGYGRARKKANAGFRTYILTGIGAALAMIISLYEYHMLYEGDWALAATFADMKYDGSRYAAQVIAGIGFLSAGTIIATSHRQVSGLTSAVGLFTSVCMGIAAGSGFYEVVIVALIMIIFAMEGMQPIERAFKRRLRHMTIYVEFDKLESLDKITTVIKSQPAQIYDLDIERAKKKGTQLPGAIVSIRLGKQNTSHSALLSSVAELECVHSIQELVS